MKLSLYNASCSYGSNAGHFVFLSPAYYISCICMFSDHLAWEQSDLGSYFWGYSSTKLIIKVHKQMRDETTFAKNGGKKSTCFYAKCIHLDHMLTMHASTPV